VHVHETGERVQDGEFLEVHTAKVDQIFHWGPLVDNKKRTKSREEAWKSFENVYREKLKPADGSQGSEYDDLDYYAKTAARLFGEQVEKEERLLTERAATYPTATTATNKEPSTAVSAGHTPAVQKLAAGEINRKRKVGLQLGNDKKKNKLNRPTVATQAVNVAGLPLGAAAA
ncbi:hypothetical protein IFR05_017591, partial [Cadophora sp. M221]